VKLWLFSAHTHTHTHTFFPSPKHTFLPGNPATSHLSITIQPSYLYSYKRQLWSLTTCEKMRTATKRLVTKSKTWRGELKKKHQKERASESAPQHHTEFSHPTAEQLPQSICLCPRLSEKQIWVILAFKNACVLVLFIFRLHANSKHRHEKEDLLVWMKSIVKH